MYVGNGVTASGSAKTLSIGENGAAGSTTTITIGAALGTGSATFNATTPVSIANTGGTALSVAGNIVGGNISATAHTGTSVSVSGAVTGGNLATGGTVSATGNVTGGNLITGGAISASGAISATGAVTGGSFATTAGITAGTTISATGNITGGNFNTAGLVSATGNVTNGIANVLTGNAIVTSLVQGTTLSATGNIIGGNLNAAGLSLSGNVVSGLSMITAITTTANITGGNILTSGVVSGGSITTAGNISIPTAAANTNTTQAATTAFVVGQAGGLSPVAVGSAVLGTSLKYAREDHTHSGVTSVTAGTAISVSATTGALTVNNTGVTALTSGGGITASVSTGSVTLGSTATSANTAGAIVARGASGEFSAGLITGTATNARYADLAENYLADADYAPGTVLDFGGTHEVTASSANSTRVAGVVSTNPAHLMNSILEGDNVTALALTGRVPTQVVGTVRKGDMMVSAGNGHAQACSTPTLGTVIGKAIEDFDGESGTIEIVVGRL